MQLVINQAIIEEWARKFFPHLGLKYGVLCVKAIIIGNVKKEFDF